MLDLSQKNILLTGGSGFLGQHVMAELATLGIPPERVRIPRSRQHDLRDPAVCREMVAGQDVVIHLAAHVGGIGLNQQKPAELFYDNLIMGAHLIQAAYEAEVEKFVCVSTICAYPKFTPVPFQEADLWIGYPEETNAPYGIAKKALLVQLQAYRQQYGFAGIYLLPVNLYGPLDNFDPASSHVIPALIRKVHEAQSQHQDFIEVWGDGSPTREFFYASDCARGILQATQAYDEPDPVNLGTGEEISIRELITLICDLMGYQGEIRWLTDKPNGQPRRCLDTQLAQQKFGFEAQVSLRLGLQKTIEWYQQVA
jgi:GDP-L-fucose synthase